MADNIGIDIPAGKIARVQFQPYNEKNQPAKIDGPVEAALLPDSGEAEISVGGVGGLFVDIRPPDAEGSVASVEVKGDPDLDPAKREVISTIITVRRLGEVPGKAISLGAKVEAVSFPASDQFGQFPQ